ncbi:tetratricopeptide repeat protein [Rhodovulum kholense]|uniref:Tetratricopeptide repeat protein n=1 Tax=Rhodovulum kholense TaxID=453584 RepID=A0A8E3ASA2_9RHOB|nr:tetratricopeptide repeat protein [Rhodovulum kholense]PTW50778.1 tetratricopeptide repeat protein [Rhodovulum kholense]
MRSTTRSTTPSSDLLRCCGLALALLCAGCAPSDRLSPAYRGLPAPPGAPHLDEAVDGLVVGHRLMAAGEYELALKAYYRAAAKQGLTADVLSAIGSANLRLGRLGQAETQLRRAIAEDERFVPAWNNLGVVLMEKGEAGEARRVFETAFALDSGGSDDIRRNLRLAIAKTENPDYDSAPNEGNNFDLVRRGEGRYLLLATP